MNKGYQGKSQAGYGLVIAMAFIAVIGFLSVQLLQHYTSQRESSDTEIRRVAGELKIIQEQSLRYFYDNEGWPSNVAELPEASGLTTVQTFGLQIMPPSSDALSFQLTAASEDQAKLLTRYMVNGVSDGLVVTSTLPPPYEVVTYDDYVQRYASTTAPERNVLEQDILANNQSVYNIDEYTGERIDSETFEGDILNTNEASVSDELSIGTARVTSTGSQINVSSSQSNFDTIRASMAQLSAGGATGQASADRFQGANFTVSGVGANENQIYFELMQLQSDLDECMGQNKNGYCFPQTPVISSMSCVGCSRFAEISDFSATISAQVRDCRHGCAYSWSRGSASGTCSPGTVNAGGTRNVSCSISGNLEPQESLNTAITLSATSNHPRALSTSQSINVRWTNTTDPAGPMDNIEFQLINYGWSAIIGPGDIGQSGVIIIPIINGKPMSSWNTQDCYDCTMLFEFVNEHNSVPVTGGNGGDAYFALSRYIPSGRSQRAPTLPDGYQDGSDGVALTIMGGGCGDNGSSASGSTQVRVIVQNDHGETAIFNSSMFASYTCIGRR